MADEPLFSVRTRRDLLDPGALKIFDDLEIGGCETIAEAEGGGIVIQAELCKLDGETAEIRAYHKELGTRTKL